MSSQFLIPFLTFIFFKITTIHSQSTTEPNGICYEDGILRSFEMNKPCVSFDKTTIISEDLIPKSSSQDMYSYTPIPGSDAFELDCDSWNSGELIDINKKSLFTMTDIVRFSHCSSRKIDRLMSDGDFTNSLENYWDWFQTFSTLSVIIILLSYVSWCCLSFWMVGWICKKCCGCFKWSYGKLKSKLPARQDASSIVEMMKRDPDFIRFISANKSSKNV